MNKLSKVSQNDKYIYKIIAIIFIIICFLMGLSCFCYYNRIQNTVKSEASAYMQEISKQLGVNVNRNIKNNFLVLETIALVLQTTQAQSYEEFSKIVSEQKEVWNYNKILLIDENGIAYDNKGKNVVLNSGSHLQDVIVNKKMSMLNSQVINGQEFIIFVLPVDTIVVNNKKIFALATLYDLSTFEKILSMSAFNDKAYAHIINKDGTTVVRSISPNAMKTGYNI